MGQLKPASPPVSPGAARPLFCPQSSGRSRWPILGDRGLRSRYLGQILLVLPPHPPLCTMGKKEATAWTTPPPKDKRPAQRPPPHLAVGVAASGAASGLSTPGKHPGRLPRRQVFPGVPPLQLLQSSPWPVSFARTPSGGHGRTWCSRPLTSRRTDPSLQSPGGSAGL